jgi:serine/threonine-protein kinase
VALFIAICDPVHYAHQQLVVHRDLKPSNILVTREGRPKLLDFGIATLSTTSTGLETQPTTAPWLTPAYASPEQVTGGTVGTASDVYALGIILYELITGRRPYDVDSCSPAEAERTIRHVMPPRPSEAIRTSGDAEVTTARRSTAARLRREVAGDLDTIVLKALAKEPARRYASVEQLAEDARRYLEGRPVRARPDSFGYRAGKFLRRHRTAAAAIVLVLASLAAGIVATGWQARRAARAATAAAVQRDRAAGEAAKASQVMALMVDLFKLSDPTRMLGDTVTARDVLDRGTSRVEHEFEDQPDLQAAVFVEVASIYANLGLLPRADTLLRRAVDLQTGIEGPSSPTVATTLIRLGETQAARGDAAGAIESLRRAIAIREAIGIDDTLLARAQAALGWELRAAGDHEEAAQLFRTALASQRRLVGDGSPSVARTLLGLAATLHDQGSFVQAESLFQSALARYDAGAGRPDPVAATALVNLGMIRRLREEYAAAEPLLRSAVAMRRTLFEPDHPDVLEATTEWGADLYALGRMRQAERLFRDGLARARAHLGERHPLTETLHGYLAMTLNVTGAYQDAIREFDIDIAKKRARLGGDHSQLVYALLRSAEPYIALGRWSEAEARLRQAAAMNERLSGTRSVARVLWLERLARVAIGRNQYPVAETQLAEAKALADDLLRPNHRYILGLRRTDADLLLALGRAPEAAAELKSVLEAQQRLYPEPHIVVGGTLVQLARAQIRLARPALAEATLRRALTNLEELPESHWEVGAATSLLGVAVALQGRDAEAQALLTDGYAIIRGHLGPDAAQTRAAEARLRQGGRGGG